MIGRRVIAGVTAGLLVLVWLAVRGLASTEHVAPDVWPWAWGIAMALSALAALHPDRRVAWIVSGCAVTAVLLARAVVQGEYYRRGIITGGQALYGSSLFSLGAWLASITWLLAAPHRGT